MREDASSTVVRVAFLWHMHQPSYRDPLDGTVVLPWVRLHALKDYLGMVALLDEFPGVHLTFNLVPSLLDQLEAYVRGEAREGLLRVTSAPPAELDETDRIAALRGVFVAHREHVIGRFPRLVELLERRGPKNDEPSLRAVASSFSVDDYRDLQVLGLLAWFDRDEQARDPLLQRLAAQGRGFQESDKRQLAERQAALLASIVPAYRRGAERGQVELTTSPYYHPILPLLCDTECHHEARPGAPLPRRYRHPEDAADQIRRAVDRHVSAFGRPPSGLWPPEGSVSEDAVREIARAGIAWTASDEAVLERSVGRPLHRDSRGTAYPLELLYRPWVRRTDDGEVKVLFRDRALSDLIGFSYSGMDPERAAADFLDRLRRVGERWQAERLEGDPVFGVILDGENCWEYYRDGGRVFLRSLYQGLQDDPGLAAVTVSEALASEAPAELPRVFAGSWIRADFSVWIGHADDRKAWDLLGDARDALESARGRVGPEALESAWEAFRAACGSDWCWWYGEEHSSENDLEFDRLFRRHIQAVYDRLGFPAPETLGGTLISTRRIEARYSHPTGAVAPQLDGEITSPQEWVAAGVYRVSLGAMHWGSRLVQEVRFGVGDESLHVLVETEGRASDRLGRQEVALSFPGPTTLRYRLGASGGAAPAREERTALGWVPSATRARSAAGSVLEVGIPLSELRPGPGRSLEFRVLVLEGGVELERHPDAVPLLLSLEEVTRD